jgi:hypothetical protein
MLRHPALTFVPGHIGNVERLSQILFLLGMHLEKRYDFKFVWLVHSVSSYLSLQGLKLAWVGKEIRLTMVSEFKDQSCELDYRSVAELTTTSKKKKKKT